MASPAQLIRRYGLLGTLRLVRDLLLTKCYGAVRGWDLRLLRSPWYIRGARGMKIGARFTSGVGFRCDVLPANEGDPEPTTPLLVVGDDVQVNDYVHLAAVHDLRIGNHVLIASRVFVSDHGHGYYDDDHVDLHEAPDVPPATRRLSCDRGVVIEDHVWLGEGVVVLPGAHIGRGSIIGAQSVVVGTIPPDSIAVGTPARVIKAYDHDAGCWKRV